MIHRSSIRNLPVLIGLTAFALLAVAVFAGPPLICFPFDIGNARSLPFVGDNWSASDQSYDLHHLSDDTLAFLQPGTPVVVRMETIRRATVYAMKDRDIAVQLLQRIEARSDESARLGKQDALTLFDLGYLIETYKQAHWKDSATDIVTGRDGYAAIARAIQIRGSDPQMEFAAALVNAYSERSPSVGAAHLKLAVAGAEEGSLLAKNLLTHAHLFHVNGDSLRELRSQLDMK